MINPYIIIGLILAYVGSIVGVGYWQRQDGAMSERDAWQKRENTQLIATARRIKSLEDDYRKKEQDAQVTIVAISTNYQKELSNADKQHEMDITAIRNGTLRMRDPGAPSLRTLGCIPTQTASPAGGRDGETGTELSNQLAEFLDSEAIRANKIVSQLGHCQEIILEDRK